MKTQTQTQLDLVAAKELVAMRRLALGDAKMLVRELAAKVKTERAAAKQTKAAAKAATAKARAQKRAERVAKLEAKLAALKAPLAGTAARKAARKPSKVTITKGPVA